MKRSKFSLSHYKLLTCDMGELVPVSWFEALPGDSIQQSTSLLVRVSPLLAPVMHPVHVRIHHWFVPNRLLWDSWEDFITGGPDGANVSEPPRIDPSMLGVGSLGDYLGIPPDIPDITELEVSALPFRAYNLIWNEWYRDQDLQAELPVLKTDGLDATAFALQNVAWEKDYFTSARPWTQKGPEVSVPLGMSAPVVGTGDLIPEFHIGGGGTFGLEGNTTTDATNWTEQPFSGGSGMQAKWANTKLQADLSAASAVNVNQLRAMFALQRYQEARARYGSRYTEYLRYLGVRPSDARLQRPEYLGGGKQTLQFSEVLQTGPDGADEGVASLKGHGIGAVRSNRYRRFFEEHGIVMTLMSVKPKTMYTQGVHKSFLRPYKENYWQRELQHIGQQEIWKGEIYANAAFPKETFGYQDRYDEYRRMESTIAGDFRDTLDFWHYGRIFATEPTLNGQFVQADPTKRPNAVQTEDVLWCMANHSIQARRMVAKGGNSFIF